MLTSLATWPSRSRSNRRAKTAKRGLRTKHLFEESGCVSIADHGCHALHWASLVERITLGTWEWASAYAKEILNGGLSRFYHSTESEHLNHLAVSYRISYL